MSLSSQNTQSTSRSRSCCSLLQERQLQHRDRRLLDAGEAAVPQPDGVESAVLCAVHRADGGLPGVPPPGRGAGHPPPHGLQHRRAHRGSHRQLRRAGQAGQDNR